MTVKPNMLVERSLIFAKLETIKGTDAVPVKATDAFLVGDADIQLDPTVLERDLYQPSLSPLPGQVGRKVANITFNHEIKGSGANGVRPKLGILLRGCGMAERLVTSGAANQIDTPFAEGAITGPAVTFAKTTAPNALYGSYLIECVLGGASATAKLRVTRWEQSGFDSSVGLNTRVEAWNNYSALTTLAVDQTDPLDIDFTVGGVFTPGNQLYAVVLGETFRLVVTSGMTDLDGVATALAALIDADSRFVASAVGPVVTVTFAAAAGGVVVTSATTALDLGGSGAEVTPSWSGNLVKGQKWIVTLHPTGYVYTPITDQTLMESLTIYFFKDGNLHKVTGCQGTVTFTGEAGNYGSAQFEFTGGFTVPEVEPLPSSGVIYEQSQPPQIELAQMSIKGDKDFCAQSFTITLGNDINPRDCMNGTEGLNGSNITNRAPTMQLNPEASIEVYTAMWGDFANGVINPLHLRVGKTQNNIVQFYAGRGSFTGLNYGDRNGTVTQEPTWQLNGVSPDGDDELRIEFPQAA